MGPLQKLWQPEVARTLYRRLRRACLPGPQGGLAQRAVRLCEDAFRDSRLLGEGLSLNLRARDWGALAGGLPALSQLTQTEVPGLSRWLDNVGNALLARHSGEQYVIALRAQALCTLERHALLLEDLLWDAWQADGAQPDAEPDFEVLFAQLRPGDEPSDEELVVRWTVLLSLAILIANWLSAKALADAAPTA